MKGERKRLSVIRNFGLFMMLLIPLGACDYHRFDPKLDGGWVIYWFEGFDESEINSGDFYRTGINLNFFTKRGHVYIEISTDVRATVDYAVNWDEKTIEFDFPEQPWLDGSWKIEEYWNESIPGGRNDDYMILKNGEKELTFWRSSPPKGRLQL